MSTLEQIVKETLERVTRMESRVVQLGDHVGANLRAKQRIEVRHDDGETFVNIDALDVSVSRVLTELRQAGVKQGAINVYHQDRVAFTVYPKDQQ